MRAARGRDSPSWCDCCGQGVLGTLSHQLQVCPRTHGARTKRHDRVSQETSKALVKSGYKVIVEPRIHTSVGFRIPDLVAYGPDKQTYVIDTTIVADNCSNLDQPHHDKQVKYGTNEDLCIKIEELTGSKPLFSSVTINWRGCFSPESAKDLLSMGLKISTLKLLATIVVEQGAIIHRMWNQSTYRMARRRRPG